MSSTREASAARRAACAGVLLLASVAAASAPEVSWDAGPPALKQASLAVVAMLVVAVIILLAIAWVRVLTGRSLQNNDDD